MALTAGEEQALLMSKLSDSSVTPDASAFRDRMMNGPPPDDSGPSFLSAYGPTLAGAAVGGPGALGAVPIGLMGLGAQGLARNNGGGGPRDPVSFQRDQPPDASSLPGQPMNTPVADVQPAPTLDPAYAKAAAAILGGAGGGAPAGGGPLAAWQKAQQRQLSSMDEEKSLTGDLGGAKTFRMQAMGDLQEANAARMQRDAEDQQKVDTEASAKMQAFMDRNTELADQIGRTKIDPGRLMRNASAGQAFSMGIAAAMGGMLAGLNGGPNQVIDHMDRMIDRDIKAQEADVDNQKSGLASRQSIFGQMLSETGDRRLAGMQTRNLMYEAMKSKLQADSDRLGIPEVKAQSLLAINAIDQKQAAMSEDMKKHAWQLAQQQAAAGVAAQRAAEERAWQRQKDVFEMGYKTDELGLKKAELGLSGAGGGGMSKEGRNKVATEQYEANRSADEFNSQMDALKQHPAIDNLGLGTAAMSGFGQRLAPGSTKTVQDIHQINTQVLQALGKVAKDADGKPDITMRQELRDRFEIHTTDTKDVALQKLEGARNVVNALARQQGATNAPSPSGPAMPSTVVRKP